MKQSRERLVLEAAATVGITTLGSIQTVTVTDGGNGYISNPNVSISQTDVVGIQTSLMVLVSLTLLVVLLV